MPGGSAGFSRKFSTAPLASTLRMPKELASERGTGTAATVISALLER